MTELEARRAAEDWVIASKEGAKFPVWAGPNYIVDHNDGSVYEFSVWANHFGIAYGHLYERGDDRWQREYEYAVTHGNTIHRPRSDSRGDGETGR